MRLLDTHVLPSALASDPRTRPAWRDAPEGADGRLASAATLWEVAIGRTRGGLHIDGDLSRVAREGCCAALHVTEAHDEAAGGRPPRHTDPFDRLLIAQAQVEGVMPVTADADFARSNVALL